MGVAAPEVGRSNFQISFPDSTSNARIAGSTIVPAINTSPLAVTIGPPRLGAPAGTLGFLGANEPSGTCHRIEPFSISTAVSVPHGGGAHGRRCAFANRNVRYIPYGAPYCSVKSTSGYFALASQYLSSGTTPIIAGRLLVFTSSKLCCGSYADPLQFIPPTFPGCDNEPCNVGGVKIPSLRRALMRSRQ